jgi:hypothetical protein
MKSWLIAAIGGFLFAIAAGAIIIWFWRLEFLNSVSNTYSQRLVGEAKVLTRDAIIYQDGKEVGTLKKGTRLVHRLETESLEEFYLPLGWENNGRINDIFHRTPKTERAFAILDVQ